MDTNLNQHAISINGNLEQIIDSRENDGNVREINELYSELEPLVNELSEQLNARSLLIEAKIVFSNPLAIQSVSELAEKMLSQFEQNPTSDTLKKSKSWSKLIKGIEGINKELSINISNSWNDFVNSLFKSEVLEEPTEISAKMDETEENNESLIKYRDLYNKYIECKNSIPNNNCDIDNVNNIVTELKRIYQNFKFDMDESVKEFIKAAKSDEGASLDLLTTEVLNWLEKSDTKDLYRIMR